MDPLEEARQAMVRRLRAEGHISDPRVVEAMARVPRHLFVPPGFRSMAYEDTPLAIGEEQTISAPHMVGMMLEALDLRPGQKVLEVGGGSGYHAGLVARLVSPGGRVISVERIPALAEQAKKNLREAGVEGGVDGVVGDGSRGLPHEAPFDRIFVTAAAPAVPPPLVEQLRDGGRLLIPVGSRHFQRLLLVERRGGRSVERDLGGCVFVPLLGAYGFRGD